MRWPRNVAVAGLLAFERMGLLIIAETLGAEGGDRHEAVTAETHDGGEKSRRSGRR